jgi:UDP-N-acetyl-D-glucosamine dehydrogenase
VRAPSRPSPRGESTTFPGTTEEVLLPLIEAGGLRVGQDFALAYSPERVDPGNPHYHVGNTPKLVGGHPDLHRARAGAIYEKAGIKVVPVSAPRVAETAKLLENVFRNVNIALVNELAMLCDRMGIDMWEVIEAAATKPFGFMRFQPGPGVGGHCIPVDPIYLAWKAKEYDFYSGFITRAAVSTRTCRPSSRKSSRGSSRSGAGASAAAGCSCSA